MISEIQHVFLKVTSEACQTGQNHLNVSQCNIYFTLAILFTRNTKIIDEVHRLCLLIKEIYILQCLLVKIIDCK